MERRRLLGRMSSRMHQPRHGEGDQHGLPRVQSLYQFTRDTSEALQLTWQGVFGRQSRFQVRQLR